MIYNYYTYKYSGRTSELVPIIPSICHNVGKLLVTVYQCKQRERDTQRRANLALRYKSGAMMSIYAAWKSQNICSLNGSSPDLSEPKMLRPRTPDTEGKSWPFSPFSPWIHQDTEAQTTKVQISGNLDIWSNLIDQILRHYRWRSNLTDSSI